MLNEISIDIIGNRTRDLPACSAVLQPTVPPRAPGNTVSLNTVSLTIFLASPLNFSRKCALYSTAVHQPCERCVCLLWRSDARSHALKHQVLQTKCFRIAHLMQTVNSYGYRVSLFSHQNTDWKLTDEGKPLNGQLWRQTRAFCSFPPLQTSMTEAT